MDDLRLPVPMFVTCEGTGEPVLFLHAGASAGSQWFGYSKALGEGFRTIAPDMPGHGRTPVPIGTTRDNAIPRMVDMIVAQVCLEGRPVHVVGHSFGALVAVALAVRIPELVASLTLVEPVCFDALRVGGHQDAYDQTRREIEMLAKLIEHGQDERAMQMVLSRWGMAQWELLSEAQRAIMVAQAPAVIGVGLVAALRWAIDAAALAKLASVPTLVVHGDRSPQSILRIAETLIAHIPNSQSVCIEGAGHMLPITHRKHFATLLRSHVQLATQLVEQAAVA